MVSCRACGDGIPVWYSRSGWYPYLETDTSSLYLAEPAELERYALVFNHLLAAALSPKESVKLIERISTELG